MNVDSEAFPEDKGYDVDSEHLGRRQKDKTLIGVERLDATEVTPPSPASSRAGTRQDKNHVNALKRQMIKMQI